MKAIHNSKPNLKLFFLSIFEFETSAKEFIHERGFAAISMS